MKNRMMLAALAVTGAISMCTAALAQDKSTTTQTTTTTMYNTDMGSRVSVSDQIFLMELAHANAMEIAEGQLAAKRAETRAVSDYASKMVADHTQGLAQIESTFGTQPWLMGWRKDLNRTMMMNGGGWYNGWHTSMNNMTPANDNPGTWSTTGDDAWSYLDSSDWDKLHHLDGLTGFAFDKEYTADQVRCHAALLTKVMHETDRGATNSTVASWVPTTQTMVQTHLDEARRLSYLFDDPFHIDRPWPWIH